MRLTAVCHRQLPHKLFRLLYKNRRSLKPVDFGIPAALKERSVPVYDGLKYSREKPPVDMSKFFPKDEKVLQAEFAYEVSNSLKLTEGLAQVQLLTNSLYHTDMPPSYVEQFEGTSLSDSEYAWMTKRLEVVKHDSYQVRLPKAWHEKYHWIAAERPYGAPVERRSRQLSLIFNDFVRLTSAGGPPKPTLNDLTCQYIRPSDNPYLFHGAACSGTLSTKALPLAGDSTATGSLPSMYPAAPEMDLKKTFDYDPRTIYPILPAGKDYSLHTIYVNHPYEEARTRVEKSGIALLQTFAFAAARGATAKKPLVLQTIYHDLEHLDLVVIQLNTLQSSSENEADIRNEIWHMNLPLSEGAGVEKTLNPTAMKWLKVFYAR
ncbi:uncharacterized protein LOC100897770 [Galendromus occidentalis]|uniref:Uncharacterized protein LOC100897770 n=1 Tax=Galendromus occidentalis TaxID=34638 RepID=A0AAJ6QR28_9ACAR|nr:uncharacterized protein LOC100897770 [Galendromus occidentalis]